MSYDENGKLDYTSKNTYKYNKKGLAVKQFCYDSSNTLTGTFTFTYYKNGKLKKQVYTSTDNSSGYTTKFNKKGM